jgi:YggT family protein
MLALLSVVNIVLDLFKWVMLAMIIMSWLISFNIINTRNQFVYSVWQILNQLTEPVLRPIRRLLPNMNGLDLSPLVVFLIIMFIQQFISLYVVNWVLAAGI